MAGSDEETVADNSMYVNKSQKVIISDLLFYIWNRLKSDPKDDIVDACVSFYANKDEMKSVKTRSVKSMSYLMSISMSVAAELHVVEPLFELYQPNFFEKIFLSFIRFDIKGW